MRVGFIVNQDVSNINYRATGPAFALKRAGHDVEIAFVQKDLRIDIERLRRCDVVHVYRLTNKETIAYLDDLQSRGVAITWDNDDDIRLLPEMARRYARIPVLQAEQDFRNQPKVFRRADVVTTTSQSLADRFRSGGARAVVPIPNYPQPAQYTSRARHDGFVIGWVAALEHHYDASALGIGAALSTLLDRHHHVRVVTIGVRLDIDHVRYAHVSGVDFSELKNHIRQFDVGIAPIADIAMNRARSDIKVKEYSAAGVPWLASARGPYVDLGSPNGGILVEDDGWEAALESVVRSRAQRLLLRRRAATWGKSQLIDRHVDEWVGAFQNAIDSAAERASSGPHSRSASALGT